MWLRLSNGREELVNNEDHIKRLKDEGAVEIDDPRPKIESVQEQSQEDAPQAPEQDVKQSESGEHGSQENTPAEQNGSSTDGNQDDNKKAKRGSK